MEESLKNTIKECTDMILGVQALNEAFPKIKNTYENAKKLTEEYEGIIKKESKEVKKLLENGRTQFEKDYEEADALVKSVTEHMKQIEEIVRAMESTHKERTEIEKSYTECLKRFDQRISAIEAKLGIKEEIEEDDENEEESESEIDNVSDNWMVYVPNSSYVQKIHKNRKVIEVTFSEEPCVAIKEKLRENYFVNVKKEMVWRGNDKNGRIDMIKNMVDKKKFDNVVKGLELEQRNVFLKGHEYFLRLQADKEADISYRLGSRLARCVRFVELSAPPVVLNDEIKLIQKAIDEIDGM